MDADTMAEFERLGVPREELLQAQQQQLAAARVPAELAAEDRLTLPRHLYPALSLAGALRTQVRVVAGGAGLLYFGLDYARLDSTKRDLGLPMRGPKAMRLLQQFQVIEREMVAVWNGRASSSAGPAAAVVA